MTSRRLIQTTLFLLLTLFIFGQCPLPTHPDYAPLMSFYNNLDGPNWTDNTGWIDGAAGSNCDPCDGTWFGISCSNDRVTQVNLYNNGLKGTITGAIGDLDSLEFFTIGIDSISGTLPNSFWQLSNLKSILIAQTQIEGTLPATLSNLTNLGYLTLQLSKFSGSLPNELFTLSNLISLNISGNDFTGNISSDIRNLNKLGFLHLGFNNFTGNIPAEITELNNLTFLLLNQNNFDGHIPENIGNLENLTYLNLSVNQLEGCYPPSLFNLCDIQNLNLSGNSELPNTGVLTQFCSSGEGTCCNQDMSPIIGNPIDSGIHASDSRIRMRGSLEQSAKYIFRATNRIEIRNSESIDIPQTSEVDFVIGECIEN